MAYIRTGSGKSYIGFSTDFKPHLGRQSDRTTITATDLPAGSTFIELDTGKTAVFDGDAWIYLPRPPRDDVVGKLSELNEAIVELLKVQREMLLLMSSG